MNKLCCNIGNFFLMNVESICFVCVHNSSLLSGQFTHSLPHQMVPSLYHTLSSVLVSPLQSVVVSVSEWHLNFASLIVIFTKSQHITVRVQAILLCVCKPYYCACASRITVCVCVHTQHIRCPCVCAAYYCVCVCVEPYMHNQ